MARVLPYSSAASLHNFYRSYISLHILHGGYKLDAASFLLLFPLQAKGANKSCQSATCLVKKKGQEKSAGEKGIDIIAID